MAEAVWRLAFGRYDVVHAVEEAAHLVAPFARLARRPARDGRGLVDPRPAPLLGLRHAGTAAVARRGARAPRAAALGRGRHGLRQPHGRREAAGAGRRRVPGGRPAARGPAPAARRRSGRGAAARAGPARRSRHSLFGQLRAVPGRRAAARGHAARSRGAVPVHGRPPARDRAPPGTSGGIGASARVLLLGHTAALRAARLPRPRRRAVLAAGARARTRPSRSTPTSRRASRSSPRASRRTRSSSTTRSRSWSSVRGRRRRPACARRSSRRTRPAPAPSAASPSSTASTAPSATGRRSRAPTPQIARRSSARAPLAGPCRAAITGASISPTDPWGERMKRVAVYVLAFWAFGTGRLTASRRPRSTPRAEPGGRAEGRLQAPHVRRAEGERPLVRGRPLPARVSVSARVRSRRPAQRRAADGLARRLARGEPRAA